MAAHQHAPTSLFPSVWVRRLFQHSSCGRQGAWLRDYEPMSERKHGDGALGAVPPSNAYRRRIAGSNWS